MIRQASTENQNAVWAIIGPVFRAGETYAVDPDIGLDCGHLSVLKLLAGYRKHLNIRHKGMLMCS